MEKTRIHIICGRCGCNDEWSWKIIKKDVAEKPEDDVFLFCENCGEINSLYDIMPKRVENSTKSDLIASSHFFKKNNG